MVCLGTPFETNTIGYSKSEEIHDKVIGTFTERENYF
nr:IS1 family transposase [Xenorhabdus indica]